jgi:hypothetical protein
MELFNFYDPIVVSFQSISALASGGSDKVNNDQGGWGGDIGWMKEGDAEH